MSCRGSATSTARAEGLLRFFVAAPAYRTVHSHWTTGASPASEEGHGAATANHHATRAETGRVHGVATGGVGVAPASSAQTAHGGYAAGRARARPHTASTRGAYPFTPAARAGCDLPVSERLDQRRYRRQGSRPGNAQPIWPASWLTARARASHLERSRREVVGGSSLRLVP